MDQNDKLANDKIAKLESEIKVLKNEVQAVLLDLRESYLNMENPFNSSANPAAVQSIVISERAPVQEPRPQRLPEKSLKQEPVEPEKDTHKPEKESPKSDKESPKPETDSPELEKNSPVTGVPSTSPEPQIVLEESELEPRTEKPPEFLTTELPLRKSIKLDLVTVAGLASWVEESSQKLGRERTEAVLDISEAMGCVPAELRPILAKLISLAPQSEPESISRTRDYIDSLIKLNSLFGQDTREEKALLLLSLISGDKNRG